MNFNREVFDQIIALPFTDHRDLDCVEECQEALGEIAEGSQLTDFFEWDVQFLRDNDVSDSDIIKFLERIRMADMFTG